MSLILSFSNVSYWEETKLWKLFKQLIWWHRYIAKRTIVIVEFNNVFFRIIIGRHRINISNDSMLAADVCVRVNDGRVGDGDGSIGDGIKFGVFVGDNSTRVDNNRESFGRQSSDSDSRIRGSSRHVITVVVAIGGGVRVPPTRLAWLVKIGRGGDDMLNVADGLDNSDWKSKSGKEGNWARQEWVWAENYI